MKKLLYIQSKFDLGGINKITSVKENYFVNHGYEVHNLNAQDVEKDGYNKMYDDRIIMHAISQNRLNRLLAVPLFGRLMRFVYYRWKMLTIIYRVNPNVIIVNMPRLEPLSVIFLSFWKKRILEFHGWFNKPIITHLRWKDRVFYSLASRFYHIVTLTKREAEKFNMLTGCNAKYIPNPLYTHPYQKSTCESKRVISLARFGPEKNLESIVPYWKIIEKKHPEWELHFYGEGPEELKIRKTINENHLSKVFIHPYTDKVEDEIVNSSIYILPSCNEGFPLVLLECMSVGVPCVAYDCPCGPAEIIRNAEDGFVTEYQNPKDMINKVLFLIENDMIRKEMGRKASKNIQRYNLDEIMKKWMKLFDII